MARRTNRGIWKGSLIAACMLYGAFYALSYTGLGKFYLLSLIELSNIPTVTISMVISEFATIMSNLSSNWGWEACLTGIALLIYFLVGWWATRRTGYVKTGILAGLSAPRLSAQPARSSDVWPLASGLESNGTRSSIDSFPTFPSIAAATLKLAKRQDPG
jgi:hypothetical protein